MCKRLLFLFATLLVIAAYPGAAEAIPSAAEDITADCAITVSSNKSTAEKMLDGSHDTAWTTGKASGQYVQIELPEGRAASGLYIMWNDVPGDWSLLESAGGSVWRDVSLGEAGSFINAFVPISFDAVRLRIESDSIQWKLSIAELKVYGSGTLPGDVQMWQPPPEKAELMVVAAHPDDEFIYFGGTIPYYAGQLGKHTAVIYMTSSPMIRKFEALDGLWKAGVREYPVFLPLANKYSSELDDAEDIWNGLDNVTGKLVSELRRFKPDVVVTHDLGGEYGHGAHKLTALAVQKAVDACSEAYAYAESAEAYGAWQVKKCYLHLLDENQIEMDWNVSLPAFEGKTALDMAKEGYALHVSQHFRERPILDTGEYDNAAYGLYYTSVGPDTAGGDFFENIPSAVPSTTPDTTATPAVRATETAPQSTAEIPAAVESYAPAASISVRFNRPGALIAVVVMMLATAGLLVISDRRSMANAKHAKKENDVSQRK